MLANGDVPLLKLKFLDSIAKSFAVWVLVALLAFLAGCALTDQWTGEGDGNASLSAPGDVWGLMPSEVASFEVVDVDMVLDEDVPRSFREDLTSVWRDALRDVGVYLEDDVSRMAIAGDGVDLAVLEASIDFGDLRGELEGLGFEKTDYRGAAIWTGRGAEFGDAALLLESQGYVVLGSRGSVRDVAQGLVRESDLLGYESGLPTVELIEDASLGWHVRVRLGCPGIVLADCEASLSSYSGGGDRVRVSLSYGFGDDVSASGGESAVRVSVTGLGDFDLEEVSSSGRVVMVSGTTSSEGLSDFTAVFDGGAASVSDDHSDTEHGATRVRPGDSVSGELEDAGDVDVFQFETRAGYSYTIGVVHGTIGRSLLRLDVDADVGREVTAEGDGGTLSWTPGSAGTYRFSVSESGGELGTYSVTLEAERVQRSLAPIIFADLNWDSAEIQTRIAGYIIEHGYEYPVEKIVTDTAGQFPAFENDALHVSMEVWKQSVQVAYDNAIAAGHVSDVGSSLEDNWQAFVIPQYIKDQNPGLIGVEDIPDYKDLFVTPDSNGKARFVTCIPGWGCETVNAQKIESYGLEDHLELINPGSGAGLFADLEGAYARGEPWLGYLWGPTKPAEELELYRLEEPEYTDACWEDDKRCAYPIIEIRILVARSLEDRAPEVVEFLRNWDFKADAQIAAEFWMTANNETADAAAVWYLNNYRDVWRSFVPDEIADRVEESLRRGSAATPVPRRTATPTARRPTPTSTPTPDDHANEDRGATRIRAGQTLDGRFETRGDVDVFRFDARGGYRYTIRVRHGSADDTYLDLRDSNGRRVASDDDSGSGYEALIEWASSSSGTYYFTVSELGDDTGTYSVSLDERRVAPTSTPVPPTAVPTATPDDHANEDRGATRIRAGQTLDGRFETRGDVDVFRFDARGGNMYTIRVRHGSADDTYLDLRDSNGRRVASDDDSGSGYEALIEWAASSSGTYFFTVSELGDDTGTYSVELTERRVPPTPTPTTVPTAIPDDHSDEDRGATRIRAGQTLDGRFETRGDVDVFRFDARGGNMYTIRVRHGTADDTYLDLRDSNGRSIASDDDSGSGYEALIEWTASSTGSYYFTVSELGDDTGTYRVELLEIASEIDTDQPRIAFVSDRDGDSEIYAMNADGSGVVQLTDNDADDVLPSWSPDGRRIAFASDRDGGGEIYVMNADGSGVVQLTDNDDFNPSWSPDGRRIAFVSGRDGDWEVYVMNSDGSGVARLTDNDADDWDLSWSPDGRRIAFVSDRDGDWEVYVMNSDGSGVAQLTDNDDLDTMPSWSPDGRRIAFTSDRGFGDDIYVMNSDGSGVARLTDSDDAIDWGPSWSPDGRRIAFVSGLDGDWEVYVMNSDGSGVAQLTDNDDDDWDPSWSPALDEVPEVVVPSPPAADQPRIAFSSDRDSGGGRGEIYVMNTDGSGVVQLTDNYDLNYDPSWSPDGSRIVFYSDSDNVIYAMHADGSGVVQLTDNDYELSGPSWSPDGRRIAFASARDIPVSANLVRSISDIYVMNADGSGVVQLTDNVADNWAPSWSPDGLRIAFVSSRDGISDIYVMNADGSGVVQLTDNDYDDLYPSWSPDGRRIAFSSDRDGDDDIYVMNADSSGVEQLTDNDRDDSDPTWSPDGRRIAFMSNRDGDWEIFVMNADGSGVVQLTDNRAEDWDPSWSPAAVDGDAATTPDDNVATDRAALIALYDATDGPNWAGNTNWKSDAPLGAWYGVTTDSEGRVESLSLGGNSLSGPIPAELGDLANLEILGLDYNSLSGPIPAELGDLANLEILGLGYNSLSGPIPAELGDLANLEGLYLGYNSLSGPIPAELGDLANLATLNLFDNSLSGPIPAELGDLANLATLNLFDNSLSGPIPAELGDLANLEELYLASNSLSGPIPAELGDLANLEILYLFDNSLSGPIPAELGDLANLEILYLGYNSLSGPIPAELGDLANLEGLYLERNDGLCSPSPSVAQWLAGYEYEFPTCSGDQFEAVADQSRIAFGSDRDGDEEIYVMNADGSGVVQLTDNDAEDVVPSWSPDGRRIAFVSWRDGDPEVYVMNSDGSDVAQLTDNDDNDWSPSWSPDGRRIAFHSDRDGDWEVYVMNANGSDVVQLTHNGVDDWSPSWSPDGRRIAFTSGYAGASDIYVMNADGSGVVQLTDNGAEDWYPSWSPDGRRIAFSSDRDGDWEVYVMNADGSGVVQLTDNDDNDWTPSWSLDGRRIAFSSDRDGDPEVYVMNADGSGVVQLTDNGAEDWDPKWSPVSAEAGAAP